MPHKVTFQVSVFFLTFIGYFLCNIVRKTPSFVQSSLISEWTPAPEHMGTGHTPWPRQSLFSDTQSAEEFMGYLNAVFLFVNAFGIVLNGMAADRLDQRVFLTAAMMLSALVMFIFGPVLEWTGGYSRPAYMGLQILNSLAQSSVWPCVLSVVTCWFDKRSRGYLLGIWTSSSSVSNIVGALVVSSVVGYGYEYAFLLTTAMLFAGAVVIFFGLVTSPQEVGLTLPCAVDDDQHKETETDCDDNDDGDSDDLHVDCGTHSYREDIKLLEESFHKSGSARASYGSSGHVRVKLYTTTADFSEQRSGDSNKEEADSTMTFPGNASHLSNVSTHKSWISTREARNISAHHTTAEDAKAQNKDPFKGACDSTVIENQYKEREISGMERQCHSDFNRSLKDHTRPIVKTVHSQQNDASSRHTNKLSQDRTCLESRSEEGVRNSLGLPMQQQAQPGEDNQEKTTRRRQPGEDNQERAGGTKPKAISFRRALLLPGVIPYSLCSVFLKLIVYVFYFWLPYYLTSSHGWTESEADRMSLWYDVGGIVGATLFTFIVSRLNKRALILAFMLTVSLPLLYGYGVLGWGQDVGTNAFLLFCFGSLLSGTNNPLSAIVSADLSQQEAARAKVRSVATVAGIMDGFGVIGAVGGQLVVPYLFPIFGWDSVFYFLMLMVCLAAACLCPLLCSEVKTVVRYWRGG